MGSPLPAPQSGMNSRPGFIFTVSIVGNLCGLGYQLQFMVISMLGSDKMRPCPTGGHGRVVRKALLTWSLLVTLLPLPSELISQFLLPPSLSQLNQHIVLLLY
jgi:hypothetical protein